MKPFRSNIKPNELTTAEKLLNLKWCTIDKLNQQLLIEFDGRMGINAISYNELDAFHKGLSAAVIAICEKARDSTARGFTVSALAAYLLDQHIDLRSAGYEDDKHWYITRINTLRYDNEIGYFSITGIHFGVEKTNEELPKIIWSPYTALLIRPSIMENLWPNSTSRILAMEAMGYSEHEVAEDILSNTPALPLKPDFNGIDLS